MQRFKQPEFWAYPILMVGLWAFFAFAMPDVLEFWEKNQLFRFSSDYWHFFDHEPFGTLIYVHTFLIQFSYYPWLGAIVYALLFTLTAFLFNRCVSTNGHHRLLPGLLTVAMMLPTISRCGLFILLMPLLASLCAYCWICLRKPILRYSCQIVTLGALTYLFHEYVLWVCLFYLCLDFYHTKNEEAAFKPYFLLVTLFGTVFLLFLFDFLYKPYSFLLTQQLFSGNFFTYTSMIPFGYFKPKGLVVYLSVFTVLSLMWTFFNPRIQKFEWIIGFLLMIGFAWLAVLRAQPMANFQKVDKLFRAYKWDESLQILNDLWKKNPDLSDIDQTKRLFITQTKVALLATRKATSQLFTYPQPAFPLLFPVSITNSAESIVLPTYYTYVGGFSESLHLNYDLITCHCISANVLNATIINSLIVNDTLPAFKLTHFLEKTLFYRKNASIYKNPSLRDKLPSIERGKQMLPEHNYTVGGYEPDKNAIVQHLNQPNNPYFYEYAICVFLLEKQHKVIFEDLLFLKNLYNNCNTFIAPRHIQEAFLASFDYVPSRFFYPQKIEGVDQEVWEDYWQFIADSQAYNNGTKSFAELQNKWGHTYWFYDCYLKPVINL